MEIRPYRRNDQDACVSIFESNTPEYFALQDRSELIAFLDDLPGPYFVCVVPEHGVAACGGYYIRAEEQLAGLTWGMVHRSFHRQGLGRQMLEYRIAAIRSLAAVRTVRVRTTHATEGFFERCGFVTASRQSDGFRSGLDLVEMKLTLP